MIDLDAIKAIPDDKPRKGPARMSKSEKDMEARRRYKDRMRRHRFILRVCGPFVDNPSDALNRVVGVFGREAVKLPTD